MFRLISSAVAGGKRSSEGGGEGGGVCAVWEFRVGENLEHSLKEQNSILKRFHLLKILIMKSIFMISTSGTSGLKCGG